MNWHFGVNSGINFNSGAPTNIPSNITSNEALSCISDGQGNTQMYCSADTIWDASNTPMPNGQGLTGNFSSSCGAMIAPVPGKCNQFYVFYTATHGTGWGLVYSLVDLTLPGNGTVPLPLGDVVVGQKDIMHYSGDNLAEKILFVQKGNTENYWVITRSITQDVFYSFEVTNAGINPVPVTSTISAATWATTIGTPLLGWLAVNKQRNLIAEANGVMTDAKIFDFDNQTGILSNEEVILTGLVFPNDIPYGISFSPSGDKLHVGWSNSPPTSLFFSSFDVTGGIGTIAPTRIDHNITSQFTNTSDVPRALIKAPDNKLYFAWGGGTVNNNMLGVINTPENITTPNIVANGYMVNGLAFLGLPNFSYYFHPDNYIDTIAGNDRTICSGNQVEIGAIGYDSVWVDYIWEPASMIQGSNNQATPMTVNLTADQQYIVHLITACGDTVMSDTTEVIIGPGLNVTLNTNSPICENQTLQLNAQPGGMGPGNYSWVSPTGPKPWPSAGVFINPFPNPIPGGWYYVTVTDSNGCSGTDSAFVVSHPVYNLRDTFSICSGDSFVYADGTVSTNILVNENHLSLDTTIFGCDSTIREYLEVKNCPIISCNGNLIPNPSFEDTVFCPTANGQMGAVQNWDKPITGSPTTGTSDYYHLCGNFSIPSNTGNAYAGFITYINFIPNAREYVQVQLNSPLVAGQCYEASMYLALESGSGYYHDSIGMLLK
jgi:hypothetical protein